MFARHCLCVRLMQQGYHRTITHILDKERFFLYRILTLASKHLFLFKALYDTPNYNKVLKVTFCIHCRGLHGPDFSISPRFGPHGYNLGPARSKEKISARAQNLGSIPARPERETEISARTLSGLKQNTILAGPVQANFFSHFIPDSLV